MDPCRTNSTERLLWSLAAHAASARRSPRLWPTTAPTSPSAIPPRLTRPKRGSTGPWRRASALGRAHDRANTLAELDRQFAINVGGVAAAVRAAAPVMGDGGRIISIGSGVGGHPALPRKRPLS